MAKTHSSHSQRLTAVMASEKVTSRFPTHSTLTIYVGSLPAYFTVALTRSTSLVGRLVRSWPIATSSTSFSGGPALCGPKCRPAARYSIVSPGTSTLTSSGPAPTCPLRVENDESKDQSDKGPRDADRLAG